jgi:hypothetical protein
MQKSQTLLDRIVDYLEKKLVSELQILYQIYISGEGRKARTQLSLKTFLQLHHRAIGLSISTEKFFTKTGISRVFDTLHLLLFTVFCFSFFSYSCLKYNFDIKCFSSDFWCVLMKLLPTFNVLFTLVCALFSVASHTFSEARVSFLLNILGYFFSYHILLLCKNNFCQSFTLK